jgi:hypothetical protein
VVGGDRAQHAGRSHRLPSASITRASCRRRKAP